MFASLRRRGLRSTFRTWILIALAIGSAAALPPATSADDCSAPVAATDLALTGLNETPTATKCAEGASSVASGADCGEWYTYAVNDGQMVTIYFSWASLDFEVPWPGTYYVDWWGDAYRWDHGNMNPPQYLSSIGEPTPPGGSPGLPYGERPVHAQMRTEGTSVTYHVDDTMVPSFYGYPVGWSLSGAGVAQGVEYFNDYHVAIRGPVDAGLALLSQTYYPSDCGRVYINGSNLRSP